MQNPTSIRTKSTKKHGARLRRLSLLSELAFIVPLFLMVFVGTVEIGNMLLTWVTLQAAAHEGAQVAMRHAEETDSERMARIMDVVNSRAACLKAGTSVVLLSDEPGFGTGAPHREQGSVRLGGRVQVRVEAAYEPLTPLFARMLTGMAVSGKAFAVLATLGRPALIANGSSDEPRLDDQWPPHQLY